MKKNTPQTPSNPTVLFTALLFFLGLGAGLLFAPQRTLSADTTSSTQKKTTKKKRTKKKRTKKKRTKKRPQPPTQKTKQQPEKPTTPAVSLEEVPENLTKAEKIVEAMLKAQGGRKALLAVRSMLGKGTTQVVTVMGDRTGQLTTYSLKPAYQRVDLRFGPQKVVQAFYPGGGWLRQNGVTLPLPRSMLEMAEEEASRVDIELRYRRDKIDVSLLGERKIRGLPCWVIVFADPKKRRTTYYITRRTSLLIKRSYVGPSPLGQGLTRFSTYQHKHKWIPIPNTKMRIRLPLAMENYMSGKKIGSITLKKISINPKNINPKKFAIQSPVD